MRWLRRGVMVNGVSFPPKEVDGGDRLFVDFSGAKHMVHGNQDRNKGSSEKLHLTSTRCTDGEKVDIVI